MSNDRDSASLDGQVPDAHAVREDELLAIRCQLGDRNAFEDLIRRWSPPLGRYLRRVAGNDHDAQELAQDVWLRVVRGISRLQDGAKLRPWLFGIARRAAMDRLREQYATPQTADLTDVDPPADGTSGMLHDDLAAMEDALERLPLIEREVLTLFYLQELSLNDVSEVLGIPVGTVKSRLFRARQWLRREMTPKGAES